MKFGSNVYLKFEFINLDYNPYSVHAELREKLGNIIHLIRQYCQIIKECLRLVQCTHLRKATDLQLLAICVIALKQAKYIITLTFRATIVSKVFSVDFADAQNVCNSAIC